LLVQALVVQLHWHFPTQNAGSLAAPDREWAPPRPDGDHERASHDCILCFEQALSAHCTLPPLVALVGEGLRDLGLVEPKSLLAISIRQVSHAWLSRGPPSLSL